MAITIRARRLQGRPRFSRRTPVSKLRPIILWVPDVHSPEFAEQARRDSLAVANSPYEKEDQAFVDSISVFWDEGWDEEWEPDAAP